MLKVIAIPVFTKKVQVRSKCVSIFEEHEDHGATLKTLWIFFTSPLLGLKAKKLKLKILKP